MAIEFNDNLSVRVNRPTDFRFGPFDSISQANSVIPVSQRYHGLFFGVYTNPNDIATSDIDFYYYWFQLRDQDYLPLGSGGNGVVIVPPPPTSTSVGEIGQVAYDENFMYMCVLTNTWIRVPIDITF